MIMIRRKPQKAMGLNNITRHKRRLQNCTKEGNGRMFVKFMEERYGNLQNKTLEDNGTNKG